MKNNIKKILFGIGVSGLALGASAFTNTEARQSGVYKYYNTAGSSDDSDRSRYEFHADDNMCAPLPANICAEEWDLGENAPQPAEGSNPPATATLVENSEQIGSFNP